MSEPQIPIATAIDYRFVSPQSQRPGLVTAIGIMSVIVASLGMLANFGMGMQAIGMLVIARLPPAALTPAPGGVVAPAATNPSQQVNASGRGFGPATRANIIAILEELEPLDEVRRQHLDALLAASGADLFSFAEAEMTRERTRAAVSDHGRKSFGTGAHYFILGSGRLEVDDAEAVFTPWGGGETISTGAGAGPGSAGPIGGAAPPPLPVNPFAGVSAAAATLALMDAMLSEGVAIFLLICGILVLRNSPRGARMHWIYVALKLPLVIFTALAWGWLYQSMFSGLGRSVPGGAGAGMGVIGTVYAIMFAVIGAAYPVALVFTLRARSVREYYSYEVGQARSTP